MLSQISCQNRNFRAYSILLAKISSISNLLLDFDGVFDSGHSHSLKRLDPDILKAGSIPLIGNSKTQSTWLERLNHQLSIRSETGQLRTRSAFSMQSGVEFDSNGRRMVHFAANDYLGLAGHPSIASQVAEHMQKSGRVGSGASPLIVGRSLELESLEKPLAEFERTESSLVFSSGFAANVGAISGLVQAEDGIFSDSLNHASIIDGCRLSKGRRWIYEHQDLGHLEVLLKTHRSECRQAFIVTDTLFSMTGDLANLLELGQLAARYDGLLIVDEAHATGVYGRRGSGLCEELEMEDFVAVRIGTLSKAIGSVGGFVSGSNILIEWLVNFARSYIYSTALPPHDALAAELAIQRIMRMHDERAYLRRQSSELRTRLQSLGWRVPSGDSPIVPISMTDELHAVQTSRRLAEQGLFIPAIRPPTVPEGQSLLRISLSLAHRPEHFDRLVDAMATF